MRISDMANRIQPSLTRKLFDMAKQYDDVIDFTLGDPDYETPDYIKKAGCEAILGGKTKYSANAGLQELRNVISDRIKKETNIVYNPEKEIQITVGAMEGIYLSLCCLINPGEEVIIPTPYWVNYKHMTEILNGVPVFVAADEEHDFIVTADAVRAAITDKTRVIIINSPNNPTGTVYDYRTLLEISQIAIEKDITIIFDECYKSILYDGAKFVSILDCPGMKEYAVIVNSCSKRYSMTGWRLGYLAGPEELITNLPKLQENIAACAPLPSQYAAITALSGDDKASDDMRNGYELRRNVLVEGINSIDKLSCKYPKGTFYAMVNIQKTGLKSEEFAYELLQSVQVAVVPGITYGEASEGYVRIAYTMHEDKIKEGLQRIKQFVDSL